MRKSVRSSVLEGVCVVIILSVIGVAAQHLNAFESTNRVVCETNVSEELSTDNLDTEDTSDDYSEDYSEAESSNVSDGTIEVYSPLVDQNITLPTRADLSPSELATLVEWENDVKEMRQKDKIEFYKNVFVIVLKINIALSLITFISYFVDYKLSLRSLRLFKFLTFQQVDVKPSHLKDFYPMFVEENDKKYASVLGMIWICALEMIIGTFVLCMLCLYYFRKLYLMDDYLIRR